MNVILISGKAGAGKDTVAKILKDNLCSSLGAEDRVLITHFADLLKYVCKMYLGWDGNKDQHGRELLQYIGTEVVRDENPNFWVDFVANILKFFSDKWDYVIIPDFRFPNEKTRLLDCGFGVVHVHVNRTTGNYWLTEKQRGHSSENALENGEQDYVLENGSITDLVSDVAQLCKEIISKPFPRKIVNQCVKMGYPNANRDNLGQYKL